MNKNNKNLDDKNNAEKYDSTQEWVNNQPDPDDCSTFDDTESYATSIYEDSDNDGSLIEIKPLGVQTDSLATEDIRSLFETLLKQTSSTNIQAPGGVIVKDSTNVHFGSKINITGPIQVIYNNKKRSSRKKEKPPATSEALGHTQTSEASEIEENVSAEAFIDRSKFKLPKSICPIVPRHSWVAQCPMEPYKFLTEPAPYVVVSHTATESSEKRAINVRIVRDVQCFHIESRGWNDIGYNFLVGCDGNVYEGRGWNVVGAHTIGYNVCSVGVSFIGCFMRELPTKAALNVFKNLLKKGVEEGYIAKDYKLITHSQCCSTESPGRKLKEELENWEHFYRIEDEVEE